MIKIIGSGVAGLWVALLLKQQGHQVHVYEKQTEDLKDSCSYRAGGMLAPYCEAENSEPLITNLGYGLLNYGNIISLIMLHKMVRFYYPPLGIMTNYDILRKPQQIMKSVM